MQAMPVTCDCGHDHEPLLPIAEACRRAAAHVTAVAETERVSLQDAAGRILAEDISARLAMPRFDQSAMDGYALAAASARGGVVLLPVSGLILAGDAAAPLVPASAVRIFTGAPLPDGADTVVMQENASQRGGQVVIAGPLEAGSHIRRRGEDIAEGEPLLRSGMRIDARHIGLLAAQGITEILVWRRPVVAVVSTGNELRQAGEVLSEGAINDSNRPMLMALAQAAGFKTVDGGCLPDNTSLLARRLLELSVRADLIVSSAGASVGDEDNSYKAALAAGGEVEALRIAMKPGKPAVVGRVGHTAYLGLPGNPVSAFVSWCFLGGAMAAALQGRNWQPPAGVLLPSASRFAHKPGRTEFVPARMLRGNGGLSIEILGHGVSAHLKPLALADGLVEIAATQGGVEPGGMLLFHAFHNLCAV